MKSIVKLQSLQTPLYSSQAINKDAGYDFKVSLRVEQSLVRVFEQEIHNARILENLKRILMNSPGLNERFLFEEIDKNCKDYIDQGDLSSYLSQYVPNFSRRDAWL